MSLKVPKANNIQLFKDGYKVWDIYIISLPLIYFLMVFALANVWPRGRGPAKYRSRLRTIRPR
jgi:hypothetical protein